MTLIHWEVLSSKVVLIKILNVILYIFRNIHNPTVDKDKNTQFIVTMDGFNPNAFLAKKLQNEGLLNEEEKLAKTTDKTKNKTLLKEKQPFKESKEKQLLKESKEKQPSKEENQVLTDNKPHILKEESQTITTKLEVLKEKESSVNVECHEMQLNTSPIQTKRLSNTSDESDTQVIIKE